MNKSIIRVPRVSGFLRIAAFFAATISGACLSSCSQEEPTETLQRFKPTSETRDNVERNYVDAANTTNVKFNILRDIFAQKYDFGGDVTVGYSISTKRNTLTTWTGPKNKIEWEAIITLTHSGDLMNAGWFRETGIRLASAPITIYCTLSYRDQPDVRIRRLVTGEMLCNTPNFDFSSNYDFTSSIVAYSNEQEYETSFCAGDKLSQDNGPYEDKEGYGWPLDYPLFMNIKNMGRVVKFKLNWITNSEDWNTNPQLKLSLSLNYIIPFCAEGERERDVPSSKHYYVGQWVECQDFYMDAFPKKNN